MIKKIASFMIIGALALSIPTYSSAKAEKKVDVDYVSLGDSLAAGQTPYHEINLGYADYLKSRMEQSQYEVDFENFGESGYTSTHLLKDVLYNNDVRNELKEADMVTLDIGANDVLGALRFNPQQAVAAVGNVGQNLHVILNEIDALNPDVDVYVMGYYNPFPYLSEAEQNQLLPLMDALNATIEKASVANGDVFVPTEDVIAENPTLYIPNPTDIHLSLEGYKAISKEFWKHLDKSNK
ncbi:SGNH/GDSL hydrolase family protein [Litchfieldia salsa]|uniref:Lysophospholipase L1 n=1 Tax=Litchfieldia salsa TaxID=930152 RepID=A0A1H0W754_9BACI|nr:GDSL-type esterase/lipase family protein [Litchfieldia salsa]SDP86106.1 Lysophospholipase L1 [Litchfieldia salsa]